jgi:uncharacterized membrane protein YidH (DUF202 family)
MYSLFITFLELLFIKWWIDSFPIARRTTLMVVSGTIGLAGYGLFVACIDRKRINYQLSSLGVTIAAIGIMVCVYIIMNNLTLNRKNGFALANERSWLLKRVFSFLYTFGFVFGLLVYSG